MENKGTLYLIPTTLGETAYDKVIPSFNNTILQEIDVFIVENIKTARRFIKKTAPDKVIDDLVFYEINKRTNLDMLPTFLKPIDEGKNIGVISDAGCPGVADPGADVVALAHQNNIKVVPLVGPSSILLSLMASGFNGQSFCFNGYLPKEQKDRVRKLKDLERMAIAQKQTQLFIETPYRNHHVMEDLLANCNPNTKLCVAVDITMASEQIVTKTIAEWKSTKIDLNKRPCVFLLG
ncbi:MAG: SAM-dependent methyltransferase [Flavobacteriales bacterium]|nr:SAM-dependent methyltransferase [Flavobacteriales bacterium]MCW8912987.1 SAM-dependent methyltransferase [Flavobacteriales bacterium]MCW8938995.1 SAM-dependent methyltransferase [Flavobacteriales bacterium]MCW8969170.1 SAM-dependent methyltransferase [Flavobacteriales bacterium]MCW8988988.1 SAM-dependent methyltransferase [Flavobacteriales bacterium]